MNASVVDNGGFSIGVIALYSIVTSLRRLHALKSCEMLGLIHSGYLIREVFQKVAMRSGSNFFVGMRCTMALKLITKSGIDNRREGVMGYQLSFARYRFRLRATTEIGFRDYSGSAWRGLFGHTLKRATCVTHEKHCANCLLYRSCVYSGIFETPPPANTEHMRLYNTVPHPFVMMPDPALRDLERGATTDLMITLIGKANQQLPYIVHAISQAGESGIGPANGKYELIAVQQESSPGSKDWQDILNRQSLEPLPLVHSHIPEIPDIVTVELKSPLRLKHNGRLMNSDNFEFAGIAGNLLRRISSLSYFHDDTPFEADFKALVEYAKTVKPLSVNLKWYDWTRYSSRQQQAMQMGGLLGTASFRGNDLMPFWPLLWIGQWLHLGKATSMGLGSFNLQPATKRSEEKVA